MDFYQKIQNATTHNMHPLADHFFLVGDVKFIVASTVGYILMSLYGPKLMGSRKEFNLKPVIQVYNLFMIVINAYIVEEIIVATTNKSWICDPASFDVTPVTLRLGKAIWIYYLTKLIEYCDTLFFILRKKFSHVTFLHVYHHASMCVYLWNIATFLPTANVFVPVVFNAVVHVIMYIYYFLSALGPKYTKYLWWKKHLTKFQMFQFMLIMFVTVISYMNGCNTKYDYLHCFIFCYMITFLFLFGQFYLTRYIRKHMQTSSKGD